MTESVGTEGFTDAAWAVWEPPMEAVSPKGKTPPKEVRRTIAAIFWRHRNGATWRAIPAGLGPWWRAAPSFIRRAELGAWERLLELAQERAGGLELGLAFLDGTNVRAHAKAALETPFGISPLRGRIARRAMAPEKGALARAETSVKRLVALAAALAPWAKHGFARAVAVADARGPVGLRRHHLCGRPRDASAFAAARVRPVRFGLRRCSSSGGNPVGRALMSGLR